MTRTGRCQCGAISYEADGEPVHNTLCHCDDCRKSAGAFVIGWAMFPRDRVCVSGEPVSFESSPGATRQFCGRCGTGLFYLNEAVFPGQVDIQSATFDDPEGAPPGARIQLADAPGWLERAGELPGFDRYPGQ